jgi:hypothetical protein
VSFLLNSNGAKAGLLSDRTERAEDAEIVLLFFALQFTIVLTGVEDGRNIDAEAFQEA